MTRALIALVRRYQRWVSVLLPPRCRFHPTCSSYAVTALEQHGAVCGSWLAVRRIARCHPFNPGGYDPVPPAGDPVPPAGDPVLAGAHPALPAVDPVLVTGMSETGPVRPAPPFVPATTQRPFSPGAPRV